MEKKRFYYYSVKNIFLTCERKKERFFFILFLLSQNRAFRLLFRLWWGPCCMHLFHQTKEELVHILICLGACLIKVTAQIPRQFFPLIRRDSPVVLHVALVTREDEARWPLGAPLGLPVELDDVLEGQWGVDGVHEDKTLAHRHVLLAENAVLVLPGRIQNVEHHRGVLDGDLLAEVRFDGGVVNRDEFAVNITLC